MEVGNFNGQGYLDMAQQELHNAVGADLTYIPDNFEQSQLQSELYLSEELAEEAELEDFDY